jgi:hypothetical protein
VDAVTPGPSAVLVMAEHGVGDPVWDRPTGTGDPLDLMALGVEPGLVGRLRTWNGRFEALASTGFRWPDEQAHRDWVADGLHLAHALQDVLPAVDVRYFEDHDDRPLRERRGR